MLTVHSERRRSDNDETELLIGERPHGTFSRQLFLSDTLDTERLEAQYTDGVLMVRIPIKEQAKPRRVNAAGGHRNAPRSMPSRPIMTMTRRRGQLMSDADRAAEVPDARRPLSLPDDNDPLYTVGQVADMLGVQPAFLRRLEAQEAVAPQRSAGGQRRYSRLEIGRIDAINRLLGEGMTVEGAKRIIELQRENALLREQLADPDSSPPGPLTTGTPTSAVQ